MASMNSLSLFSSKHNSLCKYKDAWESMRAYTDHLEPCKCRQLSQGFSLESEIIETIGGIWIRRVPLLLLFKIPDYPPCASVEIWKTLNLAKGLKMKLRQGHQCGTKPKGVKKKFKS